MHIQESNIVFLEVEDQDREVVKTRFPNAQIDNGVREPEEIIRRYADAEILCPFIYSPITADVIYGMPNLKGIVTRSVGYNHIDLKAAQERGVSVCNVPDYGSHAIAEHVFALLLSSVRFVQEGDERVELGYFDFRGLRGLALKGKTLGIVGLGKIGVNVARIASKGFLMNVLACDIHEDAEKAQEYGFLYTDQETLFRESDIISLHAPLLDSTYHMINTESIASMKDGVVLINTARGGLIDTQALLESLRSRKIAYAALDVLEHEKNIERHHELLHMKNVVVTPHIAFYADDTMATMYSEAFLSIESIMRGDGCLHRVQGI